MTFVHCNLFIKNDEETSSESEVYPTESTVAQQSNLVESNIKSLVNIEKHKPWDFSVQEFTNLSIKVIEPGTPNNWDLSLS